MEIPNSKIKIKIKATKGKRYKRENTPEKPIKLHEKPTKTFTRICPAITLQNNLVAILKGLAI